MKNKDIKGTTESGFEFTIKESTLNNFELLEVFSEVDENPLLLPKALNMLLGEEQKKKLYDHIRLEDGTVPTDKVGAELIEIFANNQKTKN